MFLGDCIVDQAQDLKYHFLKYHLKDFEVPRYKIPKNILKYLEIF